MNSITTADVEIDDEATFGQVDTSKSTLTKDGVLTIKFSRKLAFPQPILQPFEPNYAPELPEWKFSVRNVKLVADPDYTPEQSSSTDT